MKPTVEQNEVDGRAMQNSVNMPPIQIAFQSQLLWRRIVEGELGCRLEWWSLKIILPSSLLIIQLHELNNFLNTVDLHPVEAAEATHGLNGHAEVWFTAVGPIGDVEDHMLPADFIR
jgi:hypothetical protein